MFILTVILFITTYGEPDYKVATSEHIYASKQECITAGGELRTIWNKSEHTPLSLSMYCKRMKVT